MKNLLCLLLGLPCIGLAEGSSAAAFPAEANAA